MPAAVINLFSGISSETLFSDLFEKINRNANLLSYTESVIIKKDSDNDFSFGHVENSKSGDEDGLKEYLSKLYGNYFTIGKSISIVQFNLIVSLNDDSATEIVCITLKILQELIIRDQILIKINVLVPFSHLSLFFDTEKRTLVEQQRNFSTINNLIKTGKIACQVFIFQDKNLEGQVIHLDKNDFVNLLYEINNSMVYYYADIYNTLSASTYTSLGISTLYFDENYLSSLLQSESYIYLIEKEGINKQEVIGLKDIALKATAILTPYFDLYKSFRGQDYNNNPNARLENNIPRFSDKFFKGINSNILDFLHQRDISIYYKKAIFAYILGEFDDILEGYTNLYDEKSLQQNRTLEDAEYTLYLFFLQLREDASKLLSFDDIKLKKNKILVSKQYIKKLKNELEASSSNIENLSAKTKIIVESNQSGYKKRIEDLQRFNIYQGGKIGETYEKTLPNLAAELDLSANFSNDSRKTYTSQEGNTIVGIYEYFFNKSGQKLKFSADFVDYELQKHFGNNKYSFADVLSMVAETGICQLTSFSSNDNLSLEDAEREALQFKLNKALDIECNDNKIKSALNEGYPVIVILKVFDSFYNSFGNRNPILSFPSSSEILKGTTNQQIFSICGYSEKQELFLAKISGSNDIGNNGFYYIPNQYLLNNDFFLSAFLIKVISGTNSSLTLIHPSDKGKSFFNINDDNIKFFILKNGISIQEYLLKHSEELYLKERHNYEEQKADIGDPNVRKSLIDKKVESIKEREMPLQKQIEECNNEIDQKEIRIRKYNIYKILSVIVCALAIIFYLFYFDRKEFPVVVVILTIIAFLFFVYRISGWKSEIKRLKEQILNLKEEIGSLPPEIREFILKAEIHGELIDRFVQFKSGLINKYKQLHDLIMNLEEWHKQQIKDEVADRPQGPFFPIIKQRILLNDFNSHKQSLLSTINLSDSFDLEINNQTNNEEILTRFKNSVNQLLSQKLIQAMLDSFDIIDYLTGNKKYNYLPAPTEITQLSDLQKCAKPFIYLRNNVINSQEDSWFILENDPVQMQNLMNRNFSPNPFFVKDKESKYKVSFIHAIKIDNLNDVIVLSPDWR